MDVGTISIILVFGLIFLLGIGMPLGFASAVLALVVMVLKFEPTLLMNPLSFGEGLLTGRPGTGPLYILTQKIFDLMTEYVLISVPLFIFMAALLERSGVAKEMYDSLDYWLNRTRGGIAIVTSLMAVIMALIVLVIVYGIIVNRSETRLHREHGLTITRTWRERLPIAVFMGVVVLIFAYMLFGPVSWGKKLYDFGANINDAQMPHFLGLVFFPLAVLGLLRVLFNPREQELLEDEEADARALTRQPADAAVDAHPAESRRGLLLAFGWIAGYVAAIAVLGHLIATAVFSTALLLSYSPLRLWWNLLLAAASVLLLIALADLANPSLTLGGIKRVFADVEMLDPVLKYLKKPQLFGVP